MLPGLFGKAQSKEMLKPKRGRPKADVTKEHVNLRLDAAVLETLKASGPGRCLGRQAQDAHTG